MCISSKFHNDEVEAVVKSWIEKVIIGLNFCPFAKKEMQRNTVRYAIYASTHVNDALGHFLEELSVLDQQQNIQTTLLVFSNGFFDFEEYLDMLELANSLMSQEDYDGIYQVASFHPDYCFDGEAHDDPANYTNRSPYPILHILRESSIEDALKRYPEPESIPKKNIAKARKLGSSFLKALLK
jgi:hypothetical protein